MTKKTLSPANRNRLIKLGYTIASMRKIRKMSQEELARKANISRSHLSFIEVPNVVRPFSLEILFNLADALDIAPADLIAASMFPDRFLKATPDNSDGAIALSEISSNKPN